MLLKPVKGISIVTGDYILLQVLIKSTVNLTDCLTVYWFSTQLWLVKKRSSVTFILLVIALAEDLG